MCPVQSDFVSSVFQHFNSLKADIQNTYIYKILKGYEDIDTIDSDPYTRGHPLKLKNIIGNISTFSYHTVNDWSSLPVSVVLSNSINCLNFTYLAYDG